ncbi:MAG: putative transposase [Planctomycetota bacterium]|jgi:putative transposase
MRWHRKLIALKWTHQTPRVGRPGLMKEIKGLIVRMATENSTWGYSRIQGELKGLGHNVARTTVANVLKENGIKPAPNRPSSWRSFLSAHWGQIAATDFFSVEVWTPVGLKTIYVLFVIDLESRRVHLAGLTANPNEAFMAQVARNLTDCMDGFLRGHRFLICDRDTKFTARFKQVLKAVGVEVVLTPVMAPNCNAFAERFVLWG